MGNRFRVIEYFEVRAPNDPQNDVNITLIGQMYPMHVVLAPEFPSTLKDWMTPKWP